MHNFPRLLEDWAGRRLYIAGSFLQLNFSNYATAPFDQEAFEEGTAPTPTEVIKYYEPPTRVWGYDVGLQYAPAGPLAQRFVTFSSIRSEFYNEPPANDPYISNLCRAIPGGRCPA
jgi:outer membrane receptor protein involved in Fe transport